MYKLSEDWIAENYIVGTEDNTEVGDRVYIKGYDVIDEVMFPHIVTEVNDYSIKSKEDNPAYSIPPWERGTTSSFEWYIKRGK